MIHLIIFGLLLGWGAAIPIGPINLEIIRRNLHYGTAIGIALGLGACSADVTYLILLSIGALNILAYPLILKIIGVIGALILAWFGFNALRLKPASIANNETRPVITYKVWRSYSEGFFLTFINPYTILFWSSISTTIALTTHASSHATLFAGLGVLFGTTSWIIFLNVLLHFTRHRLSARSIRWLNIAGGIILLGFAIIGLWHSLL
jgi:L-lysine exporter family protein LysE/ArgO